MTIIVDEQAVTITLDPAIHRALVRMPHRQYVGLIARVRHLITRKEISNLSPPLGTSELELVLYKLGSKGFMQLREELKVPRQGYNAEVKRVRLRRRRAKRAAYMRDYRLRKVLGKGN